MTGGREHQGSSCRGVGVVRLEPFDPSSGSGRGLLAESSNAEDVRPKATARFDLAFFWIARWCVAFVPGAYPANASLVRAHQTWTYVRRPASDAPVPSPWTPGAVATA